MLTPEVPTPALSGVYRYRCLVRCLPPALSLPPSPTPPPPQHGLFTSHLYIPYVIVFFSVTC